MSSIIRTAGNQDDGFSRAENRQLQAATNAEVAGGIVANTRLSVAHFLTTTAMQHTTALAKQAYALADGDEYLGTRLGALVDGYVQFARGELDGMRRIG